MNEEILELYNKAKQLLMAHDFGRAEDSYNRIINEGNNDAEAYWGLILCKHGVIYQDDEEKTPTCELVSFDNILEDELLKNVIKYADEKTAEEYNEKANVLETARKENIYEKACIYMRGTNVGILNKAIELLENIPGYKDSEAKITECKVLLKEIDDNSEQQKQYQYESALKDAESKDVAVINKAIKKFSGIIGYKDAEQQIENCKEKLKAMEEKKEQERLAEYEQRNIIDEKKKKKTIAIAIAFTIAVILLFIAGFKIMKDMDEAALDEGIVTEAVI